nr:hypothetical protein [Paraburkholderia sp. BL8N3]
MEAPTATGKRPLPLTTFQVSLICQASASAAFVRTVNAIAKRAPGANMRVPLLPGVSASTASPAAGAAAGAEGGPQLI